METRLVKLRSSRLDAWERFHSMTNFDQNSRNIANLGARVCSAFLSEQSPTLIAKDPNTPRRFGACRIIASLLRLIYPERTNAIVKAPALSVTCNYVLEY